MRKPIKHPAAGALLLLLPIIAGLMLASGPSARAATNNLSQTPLFLTSPVEPNILLALDDSGSMDSEVLFQTNDGALWWNTTNQSFLSDESSETFNFNTNGGASGDWYKFFYLFPDGYQANGFGSNAHFAVPPIPAFAYARSPDYNKAYFDPNTTYVPWPDTNQYTFLKASPTAAPRNPMKSSEGTVDLEQESASHGGNEYEFEVFKGMTLPAGTVYDAGTGWQTAASDVAITGQAAYGIAYYPATFWVTKGTALPSYYATYQPGNTFSSTASNGVSVTNQLCRSSAQPFGSNGPTLYGYHINDACFSSSTDFQSAIQNFANWFTYYRKRSYAVRGSVGHAFSSVNDVRVGEFTINHRPASPAYLDMWNINGGGGLDGLLNQVYPQEPGGGTPNKSAVNKMGQLYESTTNVKNGSSAPVQYACQRNFGMLFTDGFSNAENLGVGNEDQALGSPFSDDVSDTMADVATQYYKNDLRPGLPKGKVLAPAGCNQTNPDPRLDCETFPHMQTFAVTLPQKGLIYGIDQNATQDPYKYPPNWDSLATDLTKNRNPAAIDDLWHATLDTRGQFLNANTPADVANSLKTALGTIAAENSTAATIATNSTKLSTDTRFYEAEFSSAFWSGNLVSFALNSTGQATNQLWSAAGQLTGSGGRNIFTFNDSTGSGGIDFSASSLSAAQQAALTPATALSSNDSWQNRLAWIAGSRSMEGAPYRKRNGTVLGDIINSDPIYVGNNNFGYAGMPETDASGNPVVPGANSYGTYLTDKQQGDGLVVVGANDGMLHAFNAKTGQEVFAYVPEGVYPNLKQLPKPAYQHHYYVDGSPAVGDVYIPDASTTGGSWHTFVVGTLGAGGRGVFGLDVTGLLTGATSSPTSSIVKWDDYPTSVMSGYAGGTATNSAGTPLADLGYTLPKANVALMNNGQWAAIVPNGYDSATGVASLYIINISNGQIIREINTNVGSPSSPDGLSGAIPVDVDGNRTTDYIYAGDLQGNLWKFNVTSSDPSKWTVTKLFQSTGPNGASQPITSQPTVGPDGRGGLMVYFGTGSYFQTGDNNVSNTSQTQTFYAVQDADVVSGGSSGNSKTLTRSDLLQQSFVAGTTVSGIPVRVSTDNKLDFSTYDGWYIDLTDAGPGERVVSTPTLDNGRIIFNTLIPSSTVCSYGGTSYLVELNALSGSRLSYTPLDLNGDHVFSKADYASVSINGQTVTVPVSAVEWGIGIVKNQAIVGKGNSEYKVAAGTASTAVKVLYENAGTLAGRLSWRQLR